MHRGVIIMEPNIQKKGNKKWFLWMTAMIFATVLIAFLTMGMFVLNQKEIYQNVYVESVDLSSLSKEAAMAKLENIFGKEIEGYKIIIQHEEKSWEFPYGQLGYHYDYDLAVEEAYAVGREGNSIHRLRDIYELRNYTKLIPLNFEYDMEMVKLVLDRLNNEIYREPFNASVTRKEGSFIITKEIPGMALDVEELELRIRDHIETFNSQPIQLPVTYFSPHITEEKLSHLEEVLGAYSTVFDSKVTGRSTNISIASNSIDGKLLMPGEAFSFNNQTGPRGVKEGYQEAPIIVNGQLVPGIGGGICQVSTTLYNAVVRADLEISSRRNHSLPVPYVPLGHDATVVYGYIDFQFINDTPYPVYVESVVQGNRVTINLHGKNIKETTVKLFSEVTETIEPKIEFKNDDTLFIDEQKVEREAKRGYRVSTYKIYFVNDQEIKRELISKDYYIPVHGVILKGTKPRPLVQETGNIPEAESAEENEEAPISSLP